MIDLIENRMIGIFEESSIIKIHRSGTKGITYSMGETTEVQVKDDNQIWITICLMYGYIKVRIGRYKRNMPKRNKQNL